MGTRQNPVQTVMATLLALLLPFCCCSLRLCAAACAESGEWLLANGANEICAAQRAACDHDHHDQHEADDVPVPAHQHGNGEGDDCGCNAHGRTMLTAGSGVVVPAMQVAAVLPTCSVLPAQVNLMTIAGAHIRSAMPRLETSLLRQHCALIV